jgi:hypothetical protein
MSTSQRLFGYVWGLRIAEFLASFVAFVVPFLICCWFLDFELVVFPVGFTAREGTLHFLHACSERQDGVEVEEIGAHISAAGAHDIELWGTINASHGGRSKYESLGKAGFEWWYRQLHLRISDRWLIFFCGITKFALRFYSCFMHAI